MWQVNKKRQRSSDQITDDILWFPFTVFIRQEFTKRERHIFTFFGNWLKSVLFVHILPTCVLRAKDDQNYVRFCTFFIGHDHLFTFMDKLLRSGIYNKKCHMIVVVLLTYIIYYISNNHLLSKTFRNSSLPNFVIY